jgi:hypothetical protein
LHRVLSPAIEVRQNTILVLRGIFRGENESYLVKTPADIAAHPMAVLQRDVVHILRQSGSIAGAERTWQRMKANVSLWSKVSQFGLDLPARQGQLNTVAFPEHNHAEVDAALRAGNKLHAIYELACGRASLVKDSSGLYKTGRRGLIVINTVKAPAK